MSITIYDIKPDPDFKPVGGIMSDATQGPPVAIRTGLKAPLRYGGKQYVDSNLYTVFGPDGRKTGLYRRVRGPAGYGRLEHRGAIGALLRVSNEAGEERCRWIYLEHVNLEQWGYCDVRTIETAKVPGQQEPSEQGPVQDDLVRGAV